MIDHMGITVSDIMRSRAFYAKTLASLGYELIVDSATSVSFGVRNGFGKSTDPGGDFWLSQGVPTAPLVHFAFCAASPMAVDAFFAEGISSGGTDNGAPQIRAHYHPHYYAAFLLDPDGYNIEAVCHTGLKQA